MIERETEDSIVGQIVTSDAVLNNSRSKFRRALHRSKKRIVMIIVLLLAIVGVSGAIFLMSRGATSPPKPPSVAIPGQSAEDKHLAKVLQPISANFVSFDKGTQQLTIIDPTSQKQSQLKTTSDTTVHKGMSNKLVTFGDLSAGQLISVSYDSESHVVRDVWYDAAQ